MNKLRVGVIGLGVGEKLLEGFCTHPNCEVTAVCDFDESKRGAIRAKMPEVIVFENACDLLDDPRIDAVCIASYDSHHYEQIIRALEQGKHVFSEKPVCVDESHAAHIQQLLQKYPDLKFTSNLIMRKYPRFQRLREMICRGDLGDLFFMEGDYNYGRLEKITEGWRGREPFYSVVYGGGVHIIDLMLWLAQDSVTEVTAMGNRIASRDSQFRFDDLAVCLLKFKSGLIAKMAVNYGCVYPHFHHFYAYGTQATFAHIPQGAFLYQSRDPKIAPEMFNEPYPGAQKHEFIHGFVDSILYGKPLEISSEEVFKAMSVCFEIEKALQRQKIDSVKNEMELS